MIFRKACESDIDAIAGIYSDIHTQEEAGRAVIGWDRAVYPTRQTAEQSLKRGDLFVAEADGKIVGCAIINQQQVDVYAQADWRCVAPDEEVMVLHTLVVSPQVMGKASEGCLWIFTRNMRWSTDVGICGWTPMKRTQLPERFIVNSAMRNEGWLTVCLMA